MTNDEMGALVVRANKLMGEWRIGRPVESVYLPGPLRQELVDLLSEIVDNEGVRLGRMERIAVALENLMEEP